MKTARVFKSGNSQAVRLPMDFNLQGNLSMDKIPNSVREVINNYLKSLEAHHIRIRKVVLFGSYATGKADEWSDIDIALVSDDFEGDWFEDRNRMRRLTLAVDNRLSPLPYRPESLLAPDPFFKKILETGIAI